MFYVNILLVFGFLNSESRGFVIIYCQWMTYRYIHLKGFRGRPILSQTKIATLLCMFYTTSLLSYVQAYPRNINKITLFKKLIIPNNWPNQNIIGLQHEKKAFFSLPCNYIPHLFRDFL